MYRQRWRLLIYLVKIGLHRAVGIVVSTGTCKRKKEDLLNVLYHAGTGSQRLEGLVGQDKGSYQKVRLPQSICISGNQILGGTNCNIKLSKRETNVKGNEKKNESEVLGIMPMIYPQVNMVLIIWNDI